MSTQKRYTITITETLERDVEVEAAEDAEALNKVKEDYDNELIVLDYSDHADTRYEISNIKTTKPEVEIFIPINAYGINIGTYTLDKYVDMLRSYKTHPDIIQFLADMLER